MSVQIRSDSEEQTFDWGLLTIIVTLLLLGSVMVFSASFAQGIYGFNDPYVFIVQQIMTQASWTDPDLRFWHYRDKDKVEVDLVITRGRRTWGIEVKAAASIKEHDAKGLSRLAAQAGKDFASGVLLYSGADVLPIAGGSFLAVPIRKLWER